MEIPYRQDEKYWVLVPANGEAQVVYGLNFHTDMERCLARLMTIEL